MQKKTVRPENLRSINMSLVLSTVLSAKHPPSRALVASEIGLTRATATKLSDELVGGGVLEESPPPPAMGPGRPAKVLKGASRVIGIGVDIGVRSIRVVAINLRGDEITREVEIVDLRGSQPHEALPLLVDPVLRLVNNLPNGSRIAGFTIAVPGLVNEDDGTLLDAPNLGWHDVDICSDVHELLKNSEKPVDLPYPTIGNEADLAAISIAFDAPGSPSELSSFVYISGGIGVGAAVSSEQKILKGDHGWAGEIGHLTVDPNGVPCRCGSQGCLERYIGEEALESALEPGNIEELETSAKALGAALAAVVNLLDVSTIVLGGSVTKLLDQSEDVVYATLQKRSMAARRNPMTIIASEAGEDASVRGAAYVALERVIGNPAEFLSSTSKSK